MSTTVKGFFITISVIIRDFHTTILAIQTQETVL